MDLGGEGMGNSGDPQGEGGEPHNPLKIFLKMTTKRGSADSTGTILINFHSGKAQLSKWHEQREGPASIPEGVGIGKLVR
jgi:hypothetical protein|mmetsp:Transcript_77964/g.130930  ORF Transcript_77964/g.130930 Transcript_77964/m.130930 type:complete len:80 (+) Transcript_77964:433-672(+)